MSLDSTNFVSIDKGIRIRQRANRRRIRSLLWGLVSLAGVILAELGVAVFLEGRAVQSLPITIQTSGAFLTGMFIIGLLLAMRIVRWSRHRIGEQLFSLWLLIGVLGILALLILRLPYSLSFFGFMIPISTVILFLFALNLSRRNRQFVGVPSSLMKIAYSAGIERSLIAMDEPKLPDQAVDMVAITDAQLDDPKWTSFLAWCTLNAVPVIMFHNYLEAHTGRVDLGTFKFNDLFRTHLSTGYVFMKRLMDIAISLLALLFLLIPMMIVAVAIRLNSPGPAIFRQKRIGLGGAVFTIYKFRSMVTTAERKGAQFAQENDSRVTGIGRFIRKYRIDEWPQLLNVLRGDMSLIGPRPEQVELVRSLSEKIPLFPFRHAVRPGITGWAQVCQGYAHDTDTSREKIAYDLFYIKNLSFLMDTVIVLRTLKIIVSGFGSR